MTMILLLSDDDDAEEYYEGNDIEKYNLKRRLCNTSSGCVYYTIHLDGYENIMETIK